MLIEQIIITIIFILSLCLIITEKIHRSIVIIGAVTLLIISGVLTIEAAVHYIDFETLLLLFGMMVIVENLKELGFFQYVAIKVAKKSGNYRNFFLFISLAVATLSPFLDSVTVVLIFSSIIIAISKLIKRDPRPLLIASILCSNIGGNATMIGEPTNIMVATHAKLTFTDFIFALTPATIISLILCLYLLDKIFNLKSIESSAEMMALIDELDETSFIKDFKTLNRALIVFVFTLLLFFVHGPLGISPALVALLGASIMLIVVNPDITTVLSKIEWGTLIFIGGFFVLVGGLAETGIIGSIAQGILNLPFTGIYMMVFISLITAFGSAVIDNIPFVAFMIPIIDQISPDIGSNVLWWTLLIGANMGGNMTPIAASPNIVVIAVSDKEGMPITFKRFVKIGVPISIVTLSASLIIILGMYHLGFI